MLSVSQKQAASALARKLPLKEVAASLNVSSRTIQRWSKSADFVAEVKRLEEEIAREIEDANRSESAAVAVRVPMLLNKAVKRLEEIIENPDSRSSDILRVCQLLGKWNGLEGDFNQSLTTLKNYGLELWQDEQGNWHLIDSR
jgi:hypothetical protein